MSPATKYVK